MHGSYYKNEGVNVTAAAICGAVYGSMRVALVCYMVLIKGVERNSAITHTHKTSVSVGVGKVRVVARRETRQACACDEACIGIEAAGNRLPPTSTHEFTLEYYVRASRSRC
jgi:hypothetical protein